MLFLCVCVCVCVSLPCLPQEPAVLCVVYLACSLQLYVNVIYTIIPGWKEEPDNTYLLREMYTYI